MSDKKFTFRETKRSEGAIEKLKAIAKDTDRSANYVVEKALLEHIEKNPPKEKK